jgi:hypothetical protein
MIDEVPETFWGTLKFRRRFLAPREGTPTGPITRSLTPSGGHLPGEPSQPGSGPITRPLTPQGEHLRGSPPTRGSGPNDEASDTFPGTPPTARSGPNYEACGTFRRHLPTARPPSGRASGPPAQVNPFRKVLDTFAAPCFARRVESPATIQGKSGALLRFSADRRSLGILTVYAALVATAWILVPDGPFQVLAVRCSATRAGSARWWPTTPSTCPLPSPVDELGVPDLVSLSYGFPSATTSLATTSRTIASFRRART